MRGLTRFDENELVTINGVDYTFNALVAPLSPRADGSTDLQFLNARNRRAELFTPDEFLAAYSAGTIRLHRRREAPGDHAADDEPPSRALRRRWRLFWTSKWDDDPVPKSTDKLAEFIKRHCGEQPDPLDPPSPHTLRAWLRNRGTEGDRRPRDMGDRAALTGARQPLHAEVQQIWREVSERHWSNRKHKFTDVVIDVEGAIEKRNRARRAAGQDPLNTPGRTTMHRWLQLERTYANICSRDGVHIANRRFKAIKGSLQAKRLLDTAIIDQKRMDVHLVDETGQFTLGRPWLAVLMDVKSRMVLGYTLTWEDPSVLSAMACVRMALRGRPQLKVEVPNVEGQWESFGVPRTILADNAWENVGSSFQDACLDQGISIEWAPVRRPEYKGILERFFETVDDQLVHKLPGAVTDKPHRLEELRIDPQADANLTLRQLDDLLARYIVDVYSLQRHGALDAAPLKIWRDRADIDGIDLAHDLPSVDHAMGTLVRDKKLTHEGVEFLGLNYRSDAVDGLLADLLPLQVAKTRAGTAVVKMKYHPEDLSRIFVWNEERKVYVAIPCIRKTYAKNLSRRVHDILRGEDRAAFEKFASEQDLVRKRADLNASIQGSYATESSLHDRRRNAKLAGDAVGRAQSNNEIGVHSLSSRGSGDRPEKAVVRSRADQKARKAEPVAANLLSAPARQISDPFAGVDWGEEVRRSKAGSQ